MDLIIDQSQENFRKEVDKIVAELSPPPSSDDDSLFEGSNSKKRPLVDCSQFIDQNQMKRAKFVPNVKNVKTLYSLLFSDEEDEFL